MRHLPIEFLTQHIRWDFLPIRSAEFLLQVLQCRKLANKKGPCFWQGPFICWLPVLDEFRNFLMSEEADIVLEHIKGF
jgi:hypothetical protein